MKITISPTTANAALLHDCMCVCVSGCISAEGSEAGGVSSSAAAAAAAAGWAAAPHCAGSGQPGHGAG